MQHAPIQEEAEILDRMAREDREYRTHWVWGKLGITPEQFNAAVKDSIAKKKIPQDEWNRALAVFKQKIETGVREQKRDYQSTNLRILSGMRA